MIIVEGNILVQTNRTRWRKGLIPLKSEDLEKLGIDKIGKTEVLIIIFKKGEPYDTNLVGRTKALYERLSSLKEEIDDVKKEAGF